MTGVQLTLCDQESSLCCLQTEILHSFLELFCERSDGPVKAKYKITHPDRQRDMKPKLGFPPDLITATSVIWLELSK